MFIVERREGQRVVPADVGLGAVVERRQARQRVADLVAQENHAKRREPAYSVSVLCQLLLGAFHFVGLLADSSADNSQSTKQH